jgi:hypothetical protein
MQRILIAVIVLALSPIAMAQTIEEQPLNGVPSSGGYKPYALSLAELLQSDKPLSDAMMSFYFTGDSSAFRKIVEAKAANGDLTAELLLGGQYIPEQCSLEPDRTVPDCAQKQTVVFRTNPLGLTASFEQAAHWLDRASAQGSGEASEELAQLITRMLASHYPTTYTVADSTRLHALARNQGFDVEDLRVSCYTRTADSTNKLEVKEVPFPGIDESTYAHISPAQVEQLRAAGIKGLLRSNSSIGSDGGSTLLMRPEGPHLDAIVILDHAPAKAIRLPMPKHASVVYVQIGDTFQRIPEDVPTIDRSLVLLPPSNWGRNVTINIQNINGSFSGTGCGQFPVQP